MNSKEDRSKQLRKIELDNELTALSKVQKRLVKLKSLSPEQEIQLSQTIKTQQSLTNELKIVKQAMEIEASLIKANDSLNAFELLHYRQERNLTPISPPGVFSRILQALGFESKPPQYGAVPKPNLASLDTTYNIAEKKAEIAQLKKQLKAANADLANFHTPSAPPVEVQPKKVAAPAIVPVTWLDVGEPAPEEQVNSAIVYPSEYQNVDEVLRAAQDATNYTGMPSNDEDDLPVIFLDTYEAPTPTKAIYDRVPEQPIYDTVPPQPKIDEAEDFMRQLEDTQLQDFADQAAPSEADIKQAARIDVDIVENNAQMRQSYKDSVANIRKSAIETEQGPVDEQTEESESRFNPNR